MGTERQCRVSGGRLQPLGRSGQTTSYLAPTCRYGSPDDFRYLVDHRHQEGIGVILDWVPSHFPEDAFALAKLDGIGCAAATTLRSAGAA
jgi:1,4-alpha-glucan branching enzyme